MEKPVIVISRAEDGDADRRAFEDVVVRTLRENDGAKLLVLPAVSHMNDGHPGLATLRALEEDLVIYASWLYPRAAYWLLQSLGIEGESPSCDGDCDCSSETTTRTIRLYDFGAFDSPEAFMLEVPQAAGVGEDDAGAAFTEITESVRRRWYPVIDHSRCTVCKQCYDFCLFGVYSLDEDDRPVVTRGDNCKPGCVACARVCPAFAIMFPHHDGDRGIAGAPGQDPVPLRTSAGAAASSCDAVARDAESCTCDASRDDLDDLIDTLDTLDV